MAGGLSNTASAYATVAGGYQNTASGTVATVGGGQSNTASGNSTTVAGGSGNTASGYSATVGGGFSNTASGIYATVGGGLSNTASGSYATVAGGLSNTALGEFSFAAGRRAKANHNGAFVWGDSTDADFASTAANQFLIRAGGGVGIGTNSPQAALHVKGNQGAFNLEGTDHVYMQFFPRGFATGRKAYFGFPSANSRDLEIANEDTGVLRVRGTFVNSSDARLKTHIADLVDPLNSLLGLRGVSYEWRTDLPNLHATKQRQIGFIAQEVEQVLPELVYTDEKGYKSVNYLGAIPVLVEAVKTLKKENTGLKATLAEVLKRLDALENARK